MSRTEIGDRFRRVVAGAVRKADAEHAAHLARLKASPREDGRAASRRRISKPRGGR